MNLRVLLIDDDEIILLMHDLMIKESGLCARTTAFGSAKDALDFLNETCMSLPLTQRNEYKLKQASLPIKNKLYTDENNREDERYLIFLDIHMPVMSGWQFLDSIQDSVYKDRVSVLITTSSIDSLDHKRSEKYPIVAEYIEKPVTTKVFARIKDSLQSLFR